MRATNGFGHLNVLTFVIQQVLGGVSTAAVVQVQAVHPGAGLLPGSVDAQPMVNQLDGHGNAFPHGTIFSLPFVRLQGGNNAVICDPAINDIGLAIFASRDISLVKATKTVSNPGSRRRFDMADGIYLGGWGNGTPTQYIQFLPGGGITLTDQFGNTVMTNSGGITITPASGQPVTFFTSIGQVSILG